MSDCWRLELGDLRRHGDQRALVGLEPELSYAELSERAAAVAAVLTTAGVEPGDSVALMFARRSHGEAIALAALLSAGVVAVPLDKSNPPARLGGILRRRSCRGLIHDPPASQLVAALKEPILAVELDAGGQVTSCQGRPSGPGERLKSTACILHTSGTTGAPKAVPISWPGLAAFTQWMGELTGLAPGRRVLRVAELVFDLAWFDHVATWRAGATLCTVSRRGMATARDLGEGVRRLRPHVIYGVPSLFVKLVSGLAAGEALPADLTVVCFAGEVFPPRQLAELSARLSDSAALFNLFGPTETNVCTYHAVERSALDGESEIPIGIAPPYARCWIASQDPAAEVIAGEGTGELWVAGPTALGGRLATGDRVERKSDGLFYFRGRIDRMVKIRGYRVQPSEVEAVLLAHEQVREAAVSAVEHPRLGKVLQAAVSLRPDGDGVDGRGLRAFVASRLAPTMVPMAIDIVAALPRTATGKVDYGALGFG